MTAREIRDCRQRRESISVNAGTARIQVRARKPASAVNRCITFSSHPTTLPPVWLGYGYVGSSLPGSAPGLDPLCQRRRANALGMAQVMQEIAGGGNGLSSLSKVLDFDDKDFWNGGPVGAAAAVRLTNDSVQRALFRGAVKGRDAVQERVDKVKAIVNKVGRRANQQADTANE